MTGQRYKRLFRFTVLLGFIVLYFIGFLSSVAAAPIPDFNPICWKKEECVGRRLNVVSGKAPTAEERKAAEGGWVQNEGDCSGEGWGKCLPAGKTVTSIAFGGQKEFANIGVFIQVLYKYALAIAGIVAAGVVIVSGAQWVASGGNSETISSAKKRIGGALIGLLLAYLSFTILNFVNPALVNFRLPQVWMVRPQGIVPQFCSDAPEKVRNEVSFVQAADYTDQVSPLDTGKIPEFNLSLKDKTDKNLQHFYCGKRFLIKDGGSSACFGDYCGKGSLCLDANNTGDPKKKYVCRAGMLGGRLSGSFGLFHVPAVDQGNNIKLMALCRNNGVVEEVEDIDYAGSSAKGEVYSFPSTNEIASICNASGGVVGFYLGVEVNDETGFTGAGWKEGAPFSSGTDDWVAVGQTAPGSHSCSVNLSKFVAQQCGEHNYLCGCGFISFPFVASAVVNSPTLSPAFAKHLISLEELEKGYTCNISIDRGEFPAINNGPALITFRKALEISASGAAFGAVLGNVIPGAGTAFGATVGATAFPAARQIAEFWKIFDDPTSCRDHQ